MKNKNSPSEAPDAKRAKVDELNEEDEAAMIAQLMSENGNEGDEGESDQGDLLQNIIHFSRLTAAVDQKLKDAGVNLDDEVLEYPEGFDRDAFIKKAAKELESTEVAITCILEALETADLTLGEGEEGEEDDEDDEFNLQFDDDDTVLEQSD